MRSGDHRKGAIINQEQTRRASEKIIEDNKSAASSQMESRVYS